MAGDRRMEHLSQLYLPGAVPVWAALVFALAAVWGYSLVLRGDEAARTFARRAYTFFALAVALAALVLAIELVRRDFRVEYVFQYSGTELPIHYQFAAFWAGQKGSFLIWLLWGALLGLGVYRTAGKAEAPTMILYTMTVMGLLLILVRENPFVMLAETPTEGQGLNPLLQDDWMVIHPPIMFVGYALSAVPFAFAMAALWRRDYKNWAARAFPWALAGFLVLGAAILMGGYWAYKTLGWGGYWGWDPVENASLIPWIFMVVLLHGLHLERTKGRYRRANYVLAGLVYLAVLYGTFLTRSGVLADFSVHSFVDLGISGWLIALMGVFFTIPAYLLATRWRQIPVVRNEDPLLSRGAFLVLSTVTLTVAALAITAGTSAPLLTNFMENPGQVGPDFYNRVNLPIAILLALLLSLVPFLTWRGTPLGQLLRKLALPALVAAAGAAFAVWLGVHDPFHVSFVFLALLALVANLMKTFERARASGIGAAGGWLSHVGVGIILVGFLASSAYDQSTKITLAQGQPTEVGDLTLTFTRMIPRQGREKESMEVRVVKADGSELFAYPKLFVNDRTRQVMANPDIKTSALRDLYISPIDFDPGMPEGAPRTVQLAQGESVELGGRTVTFAGFDLRSHAPGGPEEALASGEQIAVGAAVDVSFDGQTQRVVPVYAFTARGAVTAQPITLPGGGGIAVTGINASDGKVQLDLYGLAGGEVVPARLSLDVTKKPLIQLVWYGLYVILAGGLLSMWRRFQQARRHDEVAAAGGGPEA
jgi:cytochrome c-type biogenesis protein CcmF